MDTTVYPFGTGGQLPSSIGIVDDLVTGGHDKALSAEMGKELAGQIEELAEQPSGASMYFDDLNNRLIISTTSAIPTLNVKRNGVRVTSVLFDDTEYLSSRTMVVDVIGKNLEENITLSKTGDAFSISSNTISPTSGTVNAQLTITFAPTSTSGTATDGGRENTGTVTLQTGDVSFVLSLNGMGVEEVVPEITLTLDKQTLKGVVSGTESYDDAPSKATLTVTGRNLTADISLALSDSNKFSISDSTIDMDALENGGSVEVVVTYAQQSAATVNDDTLTITASSTGADNQTASLTASTAVKKTSGNIVAKDNIQYYFDGSTILIKKSGTPSGNIVIPSSITDDFGYIYSPVKGVGSQGFQNATGITSFEASSIITIYSSAFSGCTGMKTLKLTASSGSSTTRDSMFAGCTSLESAEFGSIWDGIGGRTGTFSGCKKLASLTLRTTTMPTPYSGGFATVFNQNEAGTMVVYEDAQGNEQQATLYVPSSKVSTYEANAQWSKFNIQAITE